MDINEANLILIKRGNVVIVERDLYYVTPRTISEQNVKLLQEYPCFKSIEEAFNYGMELPCDWEG